MQTSNIRKKFLQYFKNCQHVIIPSSPVVPHDDPTLLFINAGMNQFKDVFLGKSVRDYKRAASSQKCIRAGGKHNDLDNVGHTTRHLTFFEMLGNFSFGDYFKEEAIKFAWEVSTQIFGFDSQRIWPSVYQDDDEAFELWTAYVPPERITRFGEKENFWAMGETGPCGPCSELLYDRGPNFGNAEKPIHDMTGDRFFEYWNLVFMQYNRTADGVLQALPKPSIDTGAGLERMIGLIIGADTVFETDILRAMIGRVENVSGIAYEKTDTQFAPAFRVIADHLRCLAFAIADGAQPSNVDRGYVLRKILRRAVRYGKMLGMEEPFLAKILPTLLETMGSDYPELQQAQSRIAELLTLEEEAFIRTLRRGGNILNQIIDHAVTHSRMITGEEAFKLKDTYGFPIEEILLLAKDAELQVDLKTFQDLELKAKERSRTVTKTMEQTLSENQFAQFVEKQGTTEFLGYTLHHAIAHVKGLVVNGEFVEQMTAGEEGMVLLDKTPFYAEMGGQIGDTGFLKTEDLLFHVTDCQSPFKGLIAHLGKLEKGTLKVGETLSVTIDQVRRQKIANHHTATHLLHWALQKVLGEHIKQAGSVVEPNRLRFDFNHHKPLTKAEINQIEDLVNQKIRENLPVRWYEISYEEAQKRPDIKQFFGEKYDRLVRVIDIDYSKELCGGTHTSALGTIGLFRISKESSIAAGVRRIEAVTSEAAEGLVRQNEELLEKAAEMLKTQSSKLLERIEKTLEENKRLSQEIKSLKKGQLDEVISSLVQKVEIIQEIPLVASKLNVSLEELRLCADQMMNKLSSVVLVLASALDENKCHLIIRVSDDLIQRGIQAQEMIKVLAPIIEGTGGGKPNSAQAGGKAPEKIELAFAKMRELLKHRV